ncbi:hypothetical protein [Lysinibacillus sp. NPDC059133]|uniref:hypothetical protein n=1 Tax=Lysinibacillus sp. NPDC059133 TaxID=3346737 RepID=UPI0036CEE1DD
MIKIMFTPLKIGKRKNIEPNSIFLGGINNGKRRTGVVIAGLALAKAGKVSSNKRINSGSFILKRRY